MVDLPEPLPEARGFSTHPTRVAAVLSEPQVKVTSSYRGAAITIYGAVLSQHDLPTDIIIVVRGPERPVRIARKQQFGGLWLNSRPVVFRGAPGFFATRSSRPLQQIADPTTLERLNAGLDNLTMTAPDPDRPAGAPAQRHLADQMGPDNREWRAGVIRLRQKQGLYSEGQKGVQFVDQALFRSVISLPATAPTGVYQARIIALQGGAPVAVRERQLSVEKVGFERWVWRMAQRHGWTYGLTAVLLALGAGWLSSRIFRRT